MTTLYLIRHAEAEGNFYRRAHGHYDAAITERGYRQIVCLAKRMASVSIDAAYSSDLTRTRTTALSVTHSRGLPLRTMRELREIGVGVWEDRTWAWLAQFDRERLITFNTETERWQAEGGETIRAVLARMTAALESIIAAHPGQTVAVFSHGMALRALIGTLQGLSLAEINRTPHGENTAVTKLEAENGRIRVVYRDDASHLPDDLTTLRRQSWIKTRGGLEPGLYFLPDEGERFRVMQDGDCTGFVALRKEGGTAVITEFSLADALRGHRFSIRLLGQAVSRARALGCTELRAALPPEAPGLRRLAAELGFERTEDGQASLYLGLDEAHRVRKFEQALASIR